MGRTVARTIADLEGCADVDKTSFFITENTQQEKENDAQFLLRYIRKMKY